MKSRTLAITVWILAGVLSTGTALAHRAGFLFNTTPSLPMGLWQVLPITQKIHRDQIISICPVDTPIFKLARDRGYIPSGICPGRYEPMLKTVAAVSGDVITITKGSILVNGQTLENSTSKVIDVAGRLMPILTPGRYQVAPGSLWLVSSHNPNSFDSRYFGPLPVENVRGIARPLWIGGTP